MPRNPISPRTVPLPIWVLAGALALLVVYRFGTSPVQAQTHPDPRPEVTSAGMLSGSQFAGYPVVEQIYEEARQIPEVLDGLYCHCGCKEHEGHRSLLSCFQTAHGAGCDICLQEADMAFRMHQGGEGLEAIRDAVDAAFAP
jgi:hypothetical protein